MTIKKGTVLKGKDGYYDATYQGNVGDVHFIVNENGVAFTFSTQQLQESYELPKEKWVPEYWEKCWTIAPEEKDGVAVRNCNSSYWSRNRLANGLLYKTREEALEAVKRARGDV